jgi:hypothetical protein
MDLLYQFSVDSQRKWLTISENNYLGDKKNLYFSVFWYFFGVKKLFVGRGAVGDLPNTVGDLPNTVLPSPREKI